MKKPLTILFDATPLVNQLSGIGYYTKYLIKSLAEEYSDEVELTGYYFNFLGRKEITFDIDLPNVHFKPIRFFPGRILSPIARVTGLQLPIEFLIPKRFDWMLFSNYVSMPSLRKTPQMVAIHDLGFIEHPEYVHDKNIHYFNKLLPKVIKRARVLLTISNFTKQRIVKFYHCDTNKIQVTHIPYIENPSDSANLSVKLKELGIESNKYLLYLGTIEPRKNIINLVKAYEHMPEKLQKTTLVLAGGKGWKDEEILEAIEQAHHQGFSIIQTGYISDSDKAALYQHALGFVLPSHYEGYGMPIMEAYANNLPVTLSDIPVFREVAGDAALYFDKDNPTAIAHALEELLSNEARRKDLIQKGTKQLAIYQWKDVAQQAYEAMRKNS